MERQPSWSMQQWGLVIWIFLCVSIPDYTVAQGSHPVFEHLTVEQGLSSNKVEAMLQDRDGFYWVATQNGLNRFDGTQIRVFRHNRNDSTSLSHNFCTALVEDQNGDIWVATYKGVSRFQKTKGYFQQIYFNHPDLNFEIANRLYNLVRDTTGNIWITGNGLWKYDIRSDRVVLIEPKGPDIPEYKQINQIVFDRKQNGLWFSSGTGLIFYSISRDVFYHHGYNPPGWFVFEHADNVELCLDHDDRLWFRDRHEQVLSYFDSDDNEVIRTGKKIIHGVKQLCVDNQNRLWIFYWLADAEIFDPLTGYMDSDFFYPHHRRSAISRQGTNLFIDQDQNHWIASGKGISIFNHANQYYSLHSFQTREDTGAEPLKIKALAQTGSTHLWVATNRGLYHYDLMRRTSVYVPIPAPNENINALAADGENLWIGSYDRIMCLSIQSKTLLKSIPLKPGIIFMQKGHHPDLWIGLWSHGLCRLNVVSGQLDTFSHDPQTNNSIASNHLITGIAENHSLWIGYNGGVGFSRYASDSSRWQHYHPQKNDLSSSHAGTITVIVHDKSKSLWLGTHGGGIFRYDPVTDLFENYEQLHGLNSNFINSIIPDADGGLWISTADGMNYMDIPKRTIRSLDLGLVFSDNMFAANGISGIGGKLYFYCGLELIEVDPALFQTGQELPQLVISSFKIFDEEMPISDMQQRINLTYKQNFFSFGFSSVRAHPNRLVHYAYRLAGFDHDWKIAGTLPLASYTNVPDGDYRFEVKATNDEGVWSEALISIPIHIQPPFWRTWWFILLCIAGVASGIFALYHYRIRQIKKVFSIRTKISRDLHDDIGASLSSIHFYSSVAEQEVEDNPKKATDILKRINQNSRQIIENISDIVWANSDPKEKGSLSGRIKNYGYDLLSQKGIECRYAIDTLAEKKLSNPEARRNVLLIIKEAMNNIAKYSEAEYAEVQVMLNGAHLIVDIKDNGKGFDMDFPNHGNGLVHMNERAVSLGGTFQYHSAPGKGTEIHCRIPIPNISDT